MSKVYCSDGQCPFMGSQRNMSEQQTLTRVKDDDQQNRILMTQSFIYKSNYTVTSSHMQSLLKDDSLIPTLVGVRPIVLVLFVLITIGCIF
jgi:hypothetical protein